MPTDLTAELITDAWYPTGVRLSPDGTRVVWSAEPYGHRGEHPESGLWTAPVDGSRPARRWTRGGADTDPRWSPDSSRLAFLSDRAEPGTAGLWVLDAAGGEAWPVAVRARAVTGSAWSPDSTTLAFLAPEDPPPGEDDRRERERDDATVSGERTPTARLWTTVAAPHDSADPQAQAVLRHTGDHLVELAWSPDGTRVALLTRPRPELDSADRTRLVVCSVNGDGTGDALWQSTDVCAAPWSSSLRWAPDSSVLVLLAPHTDDPVSGSTVWVVDPDTAGAVPRLVGPAPDATVCAQAVEVVRAVPGPALSGGPVVVVVADGLATRLEGLDPAGGAASTVLLEAPGDVPALDLRSTADGSVVLALVLCADSGPPEVWAGPADRLRQLSDHHASWRDVRFAERVELSYAAADGTALDGVLLLPPDAGPGPYPTVVLPHGGPYGRSARSLACHPLDWGQWLATAGFAVVLPNYRGGSGHGLAFAAAVRGDLGGAEWGDVLAILDAVVERGTADPDRLGIGGWSQGGFLTAWAVTQTDRFRAAVMGAGVSDWRAMALTSDVPGFEGALSGGLPWDGSDPAIALSRSPITLAARVTTPTLVLHGEDDHRVPVSQGTAFHRALQDTGVHVELVTYPREPHSVGERVHQLDVLRRVRDFYGRHLGPAGADHDHSGHAEHGHPGSTGDPDGVARP